MAGFLDAAPARFRHWSLLCFGVWSAAIWLSRVRNILVDSSLAGSAKLVWLVPAVIFGLGGLLALSLWWWGRVPGVGANPERVLAAVLLATVAYWPIRALFVLLDGRSLAFQAVHLVLAVVSVGLALVAGRRLLRTNLIPRRYWPVG